MDSTYDGFNAAEAAMAESRIKIRDLTRQLSACDESPWRSMESAPKDETTVDLWTSAGERLADCHYCVSTGAWKYWLDGRWVPIVSTPTHWMPLPAAPEVV